MRSLCCIAVSYACGEVIRRPEILSYFTEWCCFSTQVITCLISVVGSYIRNLTHNRLCVALQCVSIYYALTLTNKVGALLNSNSFKGGFIHVS